MVQKLQQLPFETPVCIVFEKERIVSNVILLKEQGPSWKFTHPTISILNQSRKTVPNMNEAAIKSMADELAERNPTPSLLRRILSKRRTWVCLFISVYALLLSLSWNILHSILDWYNSTISVTSDGGGSFGWPALYASVLFGAVFGLLSMAAAFAIAIPATVVTWITILVLLTFAGKPRKALVLEGWNITRDIVGFVLKILIKEGNIVAALCAVIGYFALVGRSKEQD